MAVSVGLLVTLEAKPGREDEVAKFLNDGLAMVQQEPDTLDWYAIRLSQTTFGIFDAFPHEDGRQAHLSGRVAAALGDIASELFASPPDIKPVDVLASKVTS
ncbi:MAG: putative quinol monooxygenase [Sciscionella sp.]